MPACVCVCPHTTTVASADVLVYLGRLDYVTMAFHKALKPGGLLAFTLEALEGEGEAEEWVLRQSGRYAHSRAYVEAQAARHGFEVLDVRRIVPRKDKGEGVPGYLFIFRRRA